jgi:hypothetical protein
MAACSADWENPTLTTEEDVALQVDLTAHVQAPDYVRFVITASPEHGALTGEGKDRIYTPEANFVGVDRFFARGGAIETPVMIEINISAVNDAPLIQPDLFTTKFATPLHVPGVALIANDRDIEDEPLSVTRVMNPINGTVTMEQMAFGAGAVFTPDVGFSGTASFEYEVTDGDLPAVSTVTIEVAPNQPPFGQPDGFAGTEDSQFVIQRSALITNDVDPELQPLTVTSLGAPSQGATTHTATTTTLTPPPDYHGPITLAYTLSDGYATATQTVTVFFANVNDAPVGLDDVFAVDEDQPLTFGAPGVLGNDLDIDGDALAAVSDTLPQHGSLTLGPDGSVRYTPFPDYAGADSFSYRVRDAAGAFSDVTTVQITVHGVNDAPRPVADAFQTAEDTALVVSSPGVLGNDIDVDANDTFTAVTFTQPAHGSVTAQANGSFSYTPVHDYAGPDQFTYQARDAAGALSNPTTVAVTVTPVNDAPVASNGFVRARGITVPVHLSALDVDGDALTYTIVSAPAGGTLTGTGADRVFTPTPGVFGTHTLTFNVSDGPTVSNTATFTIEVLCGNGVVDSAEQCDEGVANSNTNRDACRLTCEWAYCGDGVMDIGEECDRGATNSNTVAGACRTTCRRAICGDGVVDGGEDCDNGSANSDSRAGACRTDCQAARCGDLVIDQGESCDRGAQAALFDLDVCTSCPAQPTAVCGNATLDPGEDCDIGINYSYGTCAPSCQCTTKPIDPDSLPPPSAGEDVLLLTELKMGDGSRAVPSNLTWSTNGNAATRGLQLISTRPLLEVRWGYIATQQVEATVETPSGSRFTETWTLGWTHQVGQTRWTSVGTLTSRVRMLLDRAAIQVTAVPTLGTTAIPKFPTDKLWTACDGIRTDTSTGLALLKPLLHPKLLVQVFQVNDSGAMLNPGFRTPDLEWSEVRPVSIKVEGPMAWTTIKGKYTVNNGLQLEEQWVLQWIYDTTVGKWSIWGVASSVERERLGELSFWWNKNRNAIHFAKDGVFGRSALVRVLSTNDTAMGITFSATDRDTQRAAESFVESALSRANLPALPANRDAAMDVLTEHLVRSYDEGSWLYIELNKLTFLRLSQVKQGQCEAIIFLSGLFEWLGIRARYAGNADSPSRFEAWRGSGFDTGASDSQNTVWLWYGYSSFDRMAVLPSPLPNIVTYPGDPHGFHVGRILWWDPSLKTLFTQREGLPCLDVSTFPFGQIAYEPIP